MVTILSIEDNNQTINEIKDYLDSNINIVKIDKGLSSITIEQIKAYKPDLILLDIELSGENDIGGIQIAERLQAENIPIIVLSCKIEHRKYLIENNLCQWFIPKPAHITIVLEKIQQYLR